MQLLRVGITHGDINGIGPEMIQKVLDYPEIQELCTPIIFSGIEIMKQTAQNCTLEQPASFNVINHAEEALDGRINLVNICKENTAIEYGQQTEISLQAEAASLQAALRAWQNNEIDVLVCCPGQLDNDQDNHALSDFIRKAVQGIDGDFDWICNSGTAPCSQHIRTLMLHPVEFSTQMGETMAQEHFMEEVQKVNNQLRQDFGFIRPRLALLAPDNAHAEQLKELRESGVVIFGPYEAKEFIEQGNYNHYDGILFLNQEEGRHQLLASLEHSYTYGFIGGLPLVLTTTMMPVSYPIAGQDKADASLLRNAIYAAIDIFRARRRYKTATRKPLEKQWNPKGRDDFKLDLTRED